MSVSKEKVRKVIKKALRFFMWTGGVLVVLLTGLYFALRSPAVQTWISQRLAAYMSDELDTKITIQGVNIQFFTSVVLEELYVEDQHGDTLLHAPSFTVDISQFDYDKQYMNLDAITLTDANIKLKKYEGEKGLNFEFFLQYFATEDTIPDTDATPWKIDFGVVKLENVKFAFIDTRWSDVDPGMDYENIRIREIYATMERIEPNGDSTSLYLSELRAKEQCGFTVDHMESRMILADTFVKFNDLIIQTPGSDIKGFIGFHFSSFSDVEDDFIHLVNMDGHFSESIVEMGDVAYFAPELLGIQKKVMLTGDMNGTVEKLKTRNMDLRFGKRSRIAGNFSFNGLPDIENTDMHFKFKETTTNYEDLSGIPVAPFNDSNFLEVPSRIGVLGDMYFTGSVEGFIHDFVAHGKLRTAQGNLVLENLVMFKDSTDEDYAWEGILTAQEFHIGNYLGVTEMGHVSGTANMIGTGTDIETMVAAMNAQFTAFEYNGYRYSNITVTEGQLAKEVFDGTVDVHDPNIGLHYEGFVDFKNPDDPYLVFDAHIDSAVVDKLGFADTTLALVVTTDMHFDMHGSNIDNLDGSITLNNLHFTKQGKPYDLTTMSLFSEINPDSTRRLSFNSDFVSIDMRGKFEVMRIDEAITDVMTAYFPAYFPPRAIEPKNKQKELQQSFTLQVQFLRNTDAIKAFVPDLMIAPQTFITGDLNQSKRIFHLNILKCDSFGYGAYEIYDIQQASIGGNGGKADLAIRIERVQVNDSTGFDNIKIKADAGSNLVNSSLSWDNETEKMNTGYIQSELVFDSEKSFHMQITDGNFTVNDSTWRIDPNNMIRRDSSVIDIKTLVFRSGNQTIGVSGRISHNSNDHLDIQIDRFNLATLNYISEANGITLRGYVAGKAQLSNLYDAPTFTGDAAFDEFYLNKERLGDGKTTATWFADRQGVYINSTFWRLLNESKEPINNIMLDGWYYPKREENNLDLNLALTNVQLGLIQPILADYCSVVNGYIDGKIAVTGKLSRPVLEGYTDITIRKIRVDYLGIELVQHKHAQRMLIHENSLEFDKFTVSDNQGDTAVIEGHLYHDNFKKFQFDMYFEFWQFMVLNTTEKDNEDYFGRVYATGFMDLFGFVDGIITMDITATTAGVYRNNNFISSDFNIPMSLASEAGTSEFIEFKDFDDTNGTEEKEKKVLFKDNGIELTLNLTVKREEALVHIIFDETVGDELSARGNGVITMHIAPNGDFTMRGTYEVEEGDYMFTLKNIVYTEFKLVPGGTISWNGDPEDAKIDADAIYVANASVEPFFPFDSTTAAYQQNYPVNVIMHLDGQLVNPMLSFDIELPTADPNIQETVRSYTQSELEMNKQVLSLMVLNSFMTPSEFRDGTEEGAGAAAGTTLLSNFVSGTLNNWLSQISDNANVKFKYRPNEDMSLQELKLALGTQLLNDRLTFDVAGSVTNATQTQTQTTYNVGTDVNVEYKLTEDGKVRIRAFNRGAENNTGIESDGTQYERGAGIFYREDFETFGELLKRYKEKITAPNPNRKERPKPAEEQQQQQNQDSLNNGNGPNK